MTRRPLPPLTTSLVLLAADTISLLVVCWTAVLTRRALGGAFPLALYAEVTPFVLLFPGLFALQGLYPGTLIAPPDALKRLSQSISLGFALLVVLSFFAKHGPLYSRGVMAMAWGASLAAVPLARTLARHLCLRQGRWGQAAVLVGEDASTARLEATLHAHPELGITPVARMDPSGALVLGTLPPLRQGVAILMVEHGQVEALLDGPLAGFGRVLLAPQLPALPSLWTDTADVAGTLLVDVRMKLLDPHRQRLKRLLDLAITLTALPLALPLVAAIALAVRLTSPGPIFFAHRRIGRGGRDIRIWKFRTMYPEADRLLAEALARDPALRQQWEACHKLLCDPRITRVGGFLRRTSLDELPQLWNVLCGDLALVGPRPIVWDEVPKYGETGFALYCKVRPGLTGLWQVSGRSTTTYAERVALDAYYVRNWSVWLDLYILARTPAALVRVHQSVVREFITPNVSRSGLDRCLRRHGVGSLKALQPKAEKPGHKPFKSYEPGFVHLDVKYLPQMPDEDKRRYLFVAIDRTTRWVFVAIYPEKTAANARRFLSSLIEAAPFRLHTILTDNGKEFTDRFITRGERTPTGRHQFDQLCEELGIEHRLTRPKHPQTNGMVERFNGRIADILRTHHFHCGEELEATILRYVWLYNHQLPQKALGHVSPIQAMKQWQRSPPELFNRRVTNQPGHDTGGGSPQSA